MQHEEVRNNEGAEIPAVNYHLWEHCNMRCKFCFAQFEKGNPEREEERRQKSFKVIEEAALAGIEKITFAGGEPLLCPWLSDLLVHAKRLGMTTMVVSNGSLLTEHWARENSCLVDWFTLSIDSPKTKTNLDSGRAVGGKNPLKEDEYLALCSLVKIHGMKLKINVTVSSVNVSENLCSFFAQARPERLKVFQVLPIQEHNDCYFNELKISRDQFAGFVRRLDPLKESCQLVAEENEAMTSSYLMIDPVGRFYSNAGGRYGYSQPIWDVGWEKALAAVRVSAKKFHQRGGHYDW